MVCFCEISEPRLTFNRQGAIRLLHVSKGFSVYAITTVNFLDRKFQDPSNRFNVITTPLENTTHEGKALKNLDSLCASIFRVTFLEIDADDS